MMRYRRAKLWLRRITQVFQSSFQQEFLSMSSEFTFGDNSDKSSFFFVLFFFNEFGWPWPHRASDHSDTDTVTTGRTTGADKGNPTVHSHATSWLEQTRGIRLFNQTSYPSFVVSCPMQFDPCEYVKWRHGLDPWRIQRGWEARTDDASAGEFGIDWKSGELEQIMNIPVTQIVEEITEVNFPVPQNDGRDRRGEQILEWVVEYSESLLWGNQSVSWMSLCETGQLIRFCVEWAMCLTRVQIDARARCVFSFS